MTGTNKFFVYPRDVDAFGFDWGKLALTVAPEVNGASRFSGGVVDLPPGQGHSRHNHPGAEEIIFVISGNGEQMVEEHRSRTNAAFCRLFTGGPRAWLARPARLQACSGWKLTREPRYFLILTPLLVRQGRRYRSANR